MAWVAKDQRCSPHEICSSSVSHSTVAMRQESSGLYTYSHQKHLLGFSIKASLDGQSTLWNYRTGKYREGETYTHCILHSTHCFSAVHQLVWWFHQTEHCKPSCHLRGEKGRSSTYPQIGLTSFTTYHNGCWLLSPPTTYSMC